MKLPLLKTSSTRYYTMRDRQKIYVLDIGRGKPVVLLHGLGLDSLSWLPYAGPRILKRRFYIPDLRGWGKSADAEIPEGYYTGQLADDVHDLILKIGYPRVTLAGVSMGAAIALEYFKRYGDQYVDRYLHIDFPAHVNTAVNPNIMPADILKRGQQMQAEAISFDRSLSLQQLPEAYQEQHIQLFNAIVQYSLKSTWQKRIAGTLVDHPFPRGLAFRSGSQCCWYPTLCGIQDVLAGRIDTRDALPNIKIPVTVLVGTHDTLFPLDELKKVGTYLPNAKLVEFDDSGHLLMLSEMQKFSRVFADFLDQDER